MGGQLCHGLFKMPVNSAHETMRMSHNGREYDRQRIRRTYAPELEKDKYVVHAEYSRHEKINFPYV
jgi:hypothetical protein